jgi:acetoacetate decarboxylase
MHLRPGIDVTIGAAIFGVQAAYEGVEGLYLLTMPMTTEGAVVGGRETYGEPKKIADITFERNGDSVEAKVARQGITYLEIRASIGNELGPKDSTSYAYCFKAMPSCEPDRLFDNDPLLVRLEWHHEMKSVHDMEGAQIVLRDSPFDPVADLPVRQLVSIQYEEGSTRSTGRVLRSIPGEWLAPYIHQRYDDTVSIMEQMLEPAADAGAAAG